ncbi:growth hormone-inducible transmembrane protein-like [Prorops nasuta]|uniref:growth hormone-inducible transmembrane protein-like n=1 Tax=Prorops nasuta TaxID=863751 RepID=UPI0034CEB0B8
MLLLRACRVGFSPAVSNVLKTSAVSKSQFIPKVQTVRLYSNQGSTYARSARKTTATVPAGYKAISIGKGAVAGASVLGIGALCYYGLGLSATDGAIDRAIFWPQYVKDRIKTTYMYFGGSVAVSALTVAACMRSPAMMNLLMRQGWMAIIGSMVAMIGSGMVARGIPYNEGFGAKQMAWLAHTGIIGAVLTSSIVAYGPVVLRAAYLTAGVVGGLSAIAICAPSDKFLNMAGPLGIGLGVVAASSLASCFLPPTTALGGGLYSIAIYGGLVVFSTMLMYDTQRVIREAESRPIGYRDTAVTFDPINNAISIYLDVINIFLRILMLQGNRKK